MTFHFVLLAAGFGRRFGSNKLLADLNGRPLYRHGLETLLALKREERYPVTVTVVTQYPSIAKALENEEAEAVINEDPSRGQASSVAAGVEAVVRGGTAADDDYIVFLAGDQPFIKKESLDRYLEQLSLKKPLLASFFLEGAYRNPGAFRRDLWPDLMSLTGDSGGREVLRACKDDVMPFTGFDPGELRDIDYPEDLPVGDGQA